MPVDQEPGKPLEVLTANASRMGFFASLKTIAWSFVGLRSSSGNRQDLSQVSPITLIAAGVIVVVVMIVSLISVVRLVLH